MVQLDYYHPLYQQLPWWHKSFGITLLVLWVLRLLMRWRTIDPEPITSHKRYERIGSRFAQFLFYLLILLLGISGYLISTAKGETISVFGWFELPSLVELTPQQVDLAGLFHEILAWSIIVLAGIHATAALKHHFVDKDKTLLRMIKKLN